MSGVVDVWCGGCHILPILWWLLVWWMSGVVDVCVVDVVQSCGMIEGISDQRHN